MYQLSLTYEDRVEILTALAAQAIEIDQRIRESPENSFTRGYWQERFTKVTRTHNKVLSSLDQMVINE